MDIHGDYFNQSEDEEDEEFDDECENSVESDNEQDDFDRGNFTYFEDLDKRFLIRNNYVFKWYRKNAGGSKYWLCKRCLQHSVTVDNNLIANENAHSRRLSNISVGEIFGDILILRLFIIFVLRKRELQIFIQQLHLFWKKNGKKEYITFF